MALPGDKKINNSLVRKPVDFSDFGCYIEILYFCTP